MNCPVCKKPIDAIQWASYVVAWCGMDVHSYPCLNGHIRGCKACRAHNGPVIQHQNDQKQNAMAPSAGDSGVSVPQAVQDEIVVPEPIVEVSSSGFELESEFEAPEGEFSPSSSEFED